MINVLYISKKYVGNYSLLNEMVKLDPQRFKVSVCYLAGRDDGNNEIENFVHKVFYLERKKGIGDFTAASRQIADIIDDNDIDIVNCQLEKTMPFGCLASHLSNGKPEVALTIHGLVGGNDIRWKKKIKNLFWFRFVSRIICVSNSIQEDVLRANLFLSGEKVTAVQNGLAYDDFHNPLPEAEARKKALDGYEGRFCFGIVGRLAEKKNHRNTITAFRKVVDADRNCVLFVVGDGPLEDKLKKLVVDLELEKNVIFLGRRTDVPLLLNAFDALVFPTYREGLPLALLEAMAARLPVIASDIPVVREVFGDTDMGILADPDDPDALAEAMLQLCRQPPDRLQSMGRNARERALADFSAEKMVHGYEEVLQQIYSEKK